MAIFNFNDLSKQSKLGYNALYNVIFAHSTSFNAKNGINHFTVPLCLNSDNKVSLTEKNFIFFDSVLDELKLFGFYNIVTNNGRAVEEVKTDYSTVEVYLSKNGDKLTEEYQRLSKEWGKSNTTFSFTDVDTSKLLKRDGKAEKAKTEENNAKKAEEAKTVAEAKQIVENAKNAEVTADEELANEEKALKNAVDHFNNEVDEDNKENLKICVEKFSNRIALIFGNDVSKEQKKEIAKCLVEFVQSL